MDDTDLATGPGWPRSVDRRPTLHLALWHRAHTWLLAVEGDDRLARRLLDASLVP